MKRIRLALAWLTGLYLGWMFFKMGWVKFDPAGFWTAAFERWGYPPWLRVLVGVIEVGGAVMLIVPPLASWGGLGLAVIMGGAGITRAGDGRWVDVAWIVLYAAACLWIAWEWWGRRWPRRQPARQP